MDRAHMMAADAFERLRAELDRADRVCQSDPSAAALAFTLGRVVAAARPVVADGEPNGRETRGSCIRLTGVDVRGVIVANSLTIRGEDVLVHGRLS